MNSEQFEGRLSEMKRRLVINTVYIVCETFNLPGPKINFNGCLGETRNQLGHYHPDQNKICISERQLKLQNFDRLKNTAIHEVTHILKLDHGPEFQRKLKELKTKSWRLSPNSIYQQYMIQCD